MKKVKNIIVYMLLSVVLLIFCVLFVGCKNNNQITLGLESGFKPPKDDVSPPSNYCAYKSDTNEFNIDDVTLEFFFGGYYNHGIEYELSIGNTYPTFDLLFCDEDGNKYYVKHIEENFVSDKYSCEVVRDENWYITEIKFNYSEKITIPSEIFNKESGQIWFQIHSANANDFEPKMQCITGISIFYKKDGDIITLSKEIQS